MAVFSHGCDGYKVRIYDVDIDMSRAELMMELESFGVVRKCWLPNTSVGSAYAVFNSGHGAENAVRKLNGRTLSGRRVKVEHVHPIQYKKDPSRNAVFPSHLDILPYHAIRSLLKQRSSSRGKRSRSKSSHYTSRRSKSSPRTRSRSRSKARSRKRRHRRGYRSRKSEKRRRHSSSSVRSTSRDESRSRSRSSSKSSSSATSVPRSRSNPSSRSISSSSARSSSCSSSSSTSGSLKPVSNKRSRLGYFSSDNDSSRDSRHSADEGKERNWVRSLVAACEVPDDVRSKPTPVTHNASRLTDGDQLSALSTPSRANKNENRNKIRITFSCKKQIERTAFPSGNATKEDVRGKTPQHTEASTTTSSTGTNDCPAKDVVNTNDDSPTETNRRSPQGEGTTPETPPPMHAVNAGVRHSRGSGQHCDDSTKNYLVTKIIKNGPSDNHLDAVRSKQGNCKKQNRLPPRDVDSSTDKPVMSKATNPIPTTTKRCVSANANGLKTGLKESLGDSPVNIAGDVLIISVNDDYLQD